MTSVFNVIHETKGRNKKPYVFIKAYSFKISLSLKFQRRRPCVQRQRTIVDAAGLQFV